jgi:hypothetical protein
VVKKRKKAEEWSKKNKKRRTIAEEEEERGRKDFLADFNFFDPVLTKKLFLSY